MTRDAARLSRLGVVITLVALIATLLSAFERPASAATTTAARLAVATRAAAALPATVTADALPTTQIDGVVWAQVVVGNVVYATGRFRTARPAGAKPGTRTVVRTNLVAYNIVTGALTSFDHRLNGEGLSIAATPDQEMLIVGGLFTRVDGKVRGHIAAFSLRTGALGNSFAPSVAGRVSALYATNTTVWAGGDFAKVGRAKRSRLAAFNRSGALLPFNGSADRTVTALMLSPRGNRLIVGGHFASLSGRRSYGIGAVDPTTGSAQAWAAKFPIRDSGPYSAITSLATDGKQVYGSGYVFGAGGNFEGRFAINPDTGALVWMQDCHGDTYSTFVVGQVLYSVGHAHDCATVGAFGESTPRISHFALATTTYATGVVGRNTQRGYSNFAGQRTSTQLDWYPKLTPGTATGLEQAAWSITGNAHYVVLGGEFTEVNGTPQQGLVRFAIRAIAPQQQGPQPATRLVPSIVSKTSTGVVVSFVATWDRDDAVLSYTLFRDDVAIGRWNLNSRFWSLPTTTTTDTGLVPGSTHSYQISVSDPHGNALRTAAKIVTLPKRAA